jgi:general secretion pathway protein F
VLGGAALLYGYGRLSRKESFLAARDRWLLKLPLAGRLIQTLALARFARILSLMLGSGVPLLRALEISSEAVVNRSFRSILEQARSAVVEGSSLSAVLSRFPLFPPLLTHLIAVGERSGTLETSLETAGQSFEREFTADTGRLMALLEPLLVLAMGLAVGLVVIAVLLPIFELNQLVK